ncbi:tetratricopeptide repeat protein [Tamlana crocina]|uniref:Get4 family protein n=1 Tax=Tamlana crocina TaxID=393006 RepID=A0ABX1DD23_9FLAO|nr:Get4 family protein [Tamlana crocina]NJX14518.1 Get4 family protein [Tamlana crocina]
MKNKNNDISQELLEAIERYVKGTMDLKERKDFDDYLKIDSNFRIQVEEVKTTIHAIEKQTLIEELNVFHQDIENKKIKKDNYNKIRFLKLSKWVAGAAVVIALLSIWFFSSSPNQKLYTKYFTPDPGLPTMMSSTNNFKFYDAMVNYKHGDYKKALEKWMLLAEKQPKNDTLNYFIGMAHMNSKDVTDAIPFLERTVQSQDSFLLKNEAHHYLGLAYLKEGNIELAKKHFKLSKTDSSKKIILELKD